MENLKKYIVLWISQSISQLGSSMTSFALVLWAYEQSRSALSVSLMSFCNYVPFIFQVDMWIVLLLSLVSGGAKLISCKRGKKRLKEQRESF